MISRLFLVTWLSLLGGMSAQAAAGRPEHRTLTATKTKLAYDLVVTLPADYDTSGKAYPVLYILGDRDYLLQSILQKDKQAREKLPALITVNVSPLPLADAPALTVRDSTLLKVAHQESTTGGAGAFLDFIEDDLIPAIQGTYRTSPSDRGLVGHGYAGTFAIYVLAVHHSLFTRVVAASPMLGADDRLLFKVIKSEMRRLPQPGRLDLSVGDEGDTTADVAALAKLLDEMKVANLDYRFTHLSGEKPNSVRHVSILQGLIWVYRP